MTVSLALLVLAGVCLSHRYACRALSRRVQDVEEEEEEEEEEEAEEE